MWQGKRFFEGRLAVRLGSKHLSTVSLGGLCIERAVRCETSDFSGTCCYQSDAVRGLLDQVPGSGPHFSSSASMA